MSCIKITFVHYKNCGLDFISAVNMQANLLTRLAERRELRERKGMEE